MIPGAYAQAKHMHATLDPMPATPDAFLGLSSAPLHLSCPVVSTWQLDKSLYPVYAKNLEIFPDHHPSHQGQGHLFEFQFTSTYNDPRNLHSNRKNGQSL